MVRSTGVFLRKDFLLSFKSSIILAVVYLVSLPLVRGISNLDRVQSALCLEQSVALVGCIVIVPVMKWEQDVRIRELVCSRPWSYVKTAALRFTEAVMITAIMITAFAWLMQKQNCVFPFFSYVAATVFLSCFMGTAGLLAALQGKNLVLGYFAAAGSYFLSRTEVVINGEKCCLLPLENGTVQTNPILFLLCIDLLLAALVMRVIRKRQFL